MNPLDLTILSLYRIDGQELPALPGLLAQNPPKKAARGREQDRLVIYLTLGGNVSYSADDYARITAQAADTFYNTPGSLTFALKTAAEGLNTTLVERNMKSTGKGLYSIGALVLCSLRGDALYVVQSGPTHVYHLGAETRHLVDAQLAGKGLGLSQTPHLYFAQTNLNAGDRVLLCAALPPNWDKSLTEGRGSTALEMTRRRLLAITDTNVSAVLMQATPGNGTLNTLQIPGLVAAQAQARPVTPPAAEAVPAMAAVVLPAALEASPAAGLPDDLTPIPAAETSAPPVELPDMPEEDELPEPEDEPADDEAPALFATELIPLPQSDSAQDAPKIDSAPEPRVLLRPETRARLQGGVRTTAGILAGLIAAWRAQMQSFRKWGRQAFPRLLPGDAEDQHLTLFSQTWPVFFAIAIPILLVVTARVVYSQLGYSAQYQIYYDHAYQASQQVAAASDPTSQRVQWQATLDWLDKADQYQQTPTDDSRKLRVLAQGELDALDKVVRLDFKPAIDGGPGRNLQVYRMSASDTDLYLLDSTTGSVLRATRNKDQKYSLDESFLCGQGVYNGITVGPLIDLIALPQSMPVDATLLGIDSSGNLLYCTPGQSPSASYLQLPDRNWNSITAIAYDNNNLYVLDAPARAVWVYFGDGEVKFPEPPLFFFGDQVPVMLEEAIDMAVNGDDLYLLHKDGHLTTCYFSHISSVSPTRCNDPALFVDTRPGYQSGMVLSDGIFTQIAFTNPPDPSVAMLEPYTQSVFRFSARALELQNQVRSGPGKQNQLPGGALVTAMAFSPNKLLFIFLNGQVYFASNAP